MKAYTEHTHTATHKQTMMSAPATPATPLAAFHGLHGSLCDGSTATDNRSDWLRLREMIVRIRREHHLDDIVSAAEPHEHSTSNRSDENDSAPPALTETVGPLSLPRLFDLSDAQVLSMMNGLKALLSTFDEMFLEMCSAANSRQNSAGSSSRFPSTHGATVFGEDGDDEGANDHHCTPPSSPHIIPVGRRRKSEALELQQQQQWPDSNSIAAWGSRSASHDPLPGAVGRHSSIATLWRRTSATSIASLPMSQQCQFQKTTSLVAYRDAQGVKWVNRYAIIGELGRGSQGKVKLAELRDDDFPTSRRLVAIKVLRRSQRGLWARAAQSSALQRIESEINIMKRLKHKNIVQLYEVIDDPASAKKNIYLIMQYVMQGPICKMVKGMTCPCFPEDRVALVARQIIAGLQYLHKHGVVHRDIKPENILVGEHGKVYLADFGVAELFECGETPIVAGRIGTPAFFAPEMFDPVLPTQHDEGTEDYDDSCIITRPRQDSNPASDGGVVAVVGLAAAVDVWALGVTVYCLLYGKAPFGCHASLSLENDVCFSDLTFPISHTISEDARDFLCGALDKTPERRMTLDKLRAHRWVARAAKKQQDTQQACWYLPTVPQVQRPSLTSSGSSPRKVPAFVSREPEHNSGALG